MFNAVNILEALKNYIRTRGGESTANNIAEAVNDLNSIPQGSSGDIPDEVINAIETHGMGWTTEEEIEGFDIQWDGNTEGHEGIPALIGGFYKVSDILDIMNPIDNLIGANYVVYTGDGPVEGTITAEDILTDDNKVFTVLALDDSLIAIALEDGYSGELNVPKGVWFANVPNYGYVSRLYKEASTEEVVHQIDQKYIPQDSGGGGMVVNVQVLLDDTITLSADKTIAEIRTAYRQGRNVIAHTYDESEFIDWWLNLNEDSEGALFFGIPQNYEAERVLFKLYAYSEDGVDTWVSDVLGNH